MSFREKTETKKPVFFDYYLTGPQGARFMLYPVLGYHQEEDVLRAKSWLRNQRDVVSIQVRWEKAEEANESPEKIPDLAIIKHQQEEIGKLKSYIEELEAKLDTERLEGDRKIRESVKSEDMYRAIKKENQKLHTENAKLRKQISELITKLRLSDTAK